jgi:hypothetical protein
MDETIARLNIEHFHKLLATELDAAKRKTVLHLLAEEEKTLAALQRASTREKTGPNP